MLGTANDWIIVGNKTLNSVLRSNAMDCVCPTPIAKFVDDAGNSLPFDEGHSWEIPDGEVPYMVKRPLTEECKRLAASFLVAQTPSPSTGSGSSSPSASGVAVPAGCGSVTAKPPSKAGKGRSRGGKSR